MNKMLFLSITSVVLSISVFGQIPNASFENWTNMGNYDNPDGWSTMNNTTAISSVFTATKATPGNPGNSYLKLTSKRVGNVVVEGLAVSGVLDSITKTPKSGFAFSERPKSFIGKWQYMAVEPGLIDITLTKWNSAKNKRDTIAKADSILIDMVMFWDNFKIEFNYLKSDFPDSCIIFLNPSGKTPSAGDYLWLDNLAFEGNVSTGINEYTNITSSFVVSPNPVSEFISIQLNDLKLNTAKIELIDMGGNVLVMKKVDQFNIQTIDIRNLTKGNYIIRLSSDSFVEEKRIYIE
jgi:hypothetical protein